MASSSTKKILLLFCGGTISMHQDPETGTLKSEYDAEQLFDIEPRIREFGDIDVENIASIDSANIAPDHWEEMTKKIGQRYDDYDGFVVTMGTDTLAYTSSALSFALGDIGKPVVITGAQIPLKVPGSDGRGNLINALRVATIDVAGVLVVFGSKIILGCRAKKVSTSALDAFNPLNHATFGSIDMHIVINDTEHKRHSRPPKFEGAFEKHVLCVSITPGIQPHYITSLLEQGIRGIVLRAYGAGNVPEVLIPVLEQAQKNSVPVVITSQCPAGSTMMDLYEPGKKALDAGVIQAYDMSIEAATTKLMWLLGQQTPYKDIPVMMQTNLCGELDAGQMRIMG